MAEITAANVGKLREMTGAGLMDCKKALVEAKGDIEAAMDYLRKKGIASAAKKAGRAANEGVIAQHIAPGAKVGVLVEINCETDFVAKNDGFRAFCDDIAKKLAGESKRGFGSRPRRRRGEDWREHQNFAASAHRSFRQRTRRGLHPHRRESRRARRSRRGQGRRRRRKEEFKQLVRDITLQIAAGHPHAVSREQVPPEVIAKEREIAA